jgi:hypothetical protein
MVGLQNNIKVTVIRNAAGSYTGSPDAGCRDAAPTYYCAGRLSTLLPSGCGANTQDLYDPSMNRKVICVMNYFDAPSEHYVPFYRSDMVNPIDLQCELDVGDEIVCVWKPLLVLSPTQLVASLSQIVLPDKKGL